VDELFNLIKDLVKRRFYGALEIKFEAGRIVIVKKTESIKLSKDR